MPPEDDKSKGGGTGGEGNAPDPAKELADLKAKYADLETKYSALNKKQPDPENDPDLKERARMSREAEDKKKGDSKALEKALTFSLKSQEFLKQNEALLPKDVEDIFKQAEKENYDSAIEKDAAIKAGIVQSFFSVQANVDLLTPGLKAQLEDYLKLTKTGKQEKAQHIYESIFEPSFEMLKRLKKAEALSKGFGGGADEDAYKAKLQKLSREHYLGEKAK